MPPIAGNARAGKAMPPIDRAPEASLLRKSASSFLRAGIVELGTGLMLRVGSSISTIGSGSGSGAGAGAAVEAAHKS